MTAKKIPGQGLTGEREFRDRCASYLQERWVRITSAFQQPAADMPAEPLGAEHPLKPAIRDCLTSVTKSYHYVLPTHLLAKCVDPSLDARSIQVSYGVSGAFDARSLAHEVIVPFDQQNYNVLGGSAEPYANNPLRIPAVLPQYRSAQKRGEDWDKLVMVLNTVEESDNEGFTQAVFDQVLYEIFRLLSGVIVTYPTPNRISLEATYKLMDHFLEERSGGDRIEAVATALFQTIGEKFRLFTRVRRERVNAADRSSGMAADIECYLDDRLVLLVEVKDRALTLIQLNAKLDRARSQHIAEILFIAQQREEESEKTQIRNRISAEFTSGQNIYVTSFNDFALGILILLGESGRVQFLTHVGVELDRAGSAIQHRRAWADLLRQV